MKRTLSSLYPLPASVFQIPLFRFTHHHFNDPEARIRQSLLSRPLLLSPLSLQNRFFIGTFVLLFFLLSLPDTTLGSGLNVSAYVPSTNLTKGEHFTLNVQVQSRETHSISQPGLPELDGLQYLSTVPRTSTSYSLVNGVSQMTYRFSYTLQATDEGAIQIPPVYLNIDGKEYATAPITLFVRPAEEKISPHPIPDATSRPEIFLELGLSEEAPVRGQQIITEVILYFRNTINVNTFHITQSWQTEGFWKEDLNESPTRRPESVILDGLSYRRAVIARYALFPTRTGELTIPPFMIRASIRQTSRYGDDFHSLFDGFGRQRSVDLKSAPRTIQVKAPPPPPADGQLISALGQFEINRTLARDRIVLGEAVDVITQIQGIGNLGLITRPTYKYPENFDTHRPQEIIRRDEEKPYVSGVKEFRDVLIARTAGTFTIPEHTLWVYNDLKRRYQRHRLPALTLEVVRDPNARITIAASDRLPIQPIRGSVTWHTSEKRSFYQDRWFRAGLLFPILLLAIGYRKYLYHKKLASDRGFYRFEHAWNNAIAILNQAHPQMEPREAYRLIYQSLSIFITDKLNLPASGLTEQEITEALLRQQADEDVAEKTRRLLVKSATIRFAPESAYADIEADIKEAHQILNLLKNHFKKTVIKETEADH